MEAKATYGSHPYGTKGKRDVHSGKAKLRWPERRVEPSDVSVRKMDPVEVALAAIDAHSTAARRRRIYLGV